MVPPCSAGVHGALGAAGRAPALPSQQYVLCLSAAKRAGRVSGCAAARRHPDQRAVLGLWGQQAGHQGFASMQWF